MENVWSLLCESSSIDVETNSLSVFKCVEGIKLEIDKTKLSKDNGIIIPANFQLISFWAITDSTKKNSCEIKIELIDPKSKVLREFVNTLETKAGEARLRNITKINGLQITESGRYYYQVSQKKANKFVVVSRLPLDLELSYRIFTNVAEGK